MHLPTLDEISNAAELVHQHIAPTPQYKWPILCNRCETEVWVKHENTTPIGSFKIRGGITYLASCAKSNIDHVIAATSGNHGQSITYAARLFGIKATIVAPHGNSSSKIKSMRALGANLIEYGQDFSEALPHAQHLSEQNGIHFVGSFNRKLVVGVASYALELFQAVSNLDCVYVPIGLGSEICGVIATREALGLHQTEIIGVVAENAPAYSLSFAAGNPVSTESSLTLADGVAVRVPDPQALDIILKHTSRIITVSEYEIASAMRYFFTDAHHVIEGAGATSLAALIKEKPNMSGKRVAVIASGGNVDLDLYCEILRGNFPPK